WSRACRGEPLRGELRPGIAFGKPLEATGFLRSPAPPSTPTSMRHAYASLVLALLLSASPATAQEWTTQSPVPTDLDVRGVGVPTPTRVFIATEDDSFDDGGALWESTDGGVT